MGVIVLSIIWSAGTVCAGIVSATNSLTLSDDSDDVLRTTAGFPNMQSTLRAKKYRVPKNTECQKIPSAKKYRHWNDCLSFMIIPDQVPAKLHTLYGKSARDDIDR